MDAVRTALRAAGLGRDPAGPSSAAGDAQPFSLYKRAIISIDTLKNDRYLAHLRRHRWDAVVIDESHNVTNSATQNNRLANVLAPQTDALILASATPHNGNKESFAELVRLLEPTAVSPEGDVDAEDLKKLVIRRHRHSPEVATIVGPQWAERQEPVNRLVTASPQENEVAAELADRWLYTEERKSSGDRLFGWVLAKAFLSSPAALAETARTRLARSHDDERGNPADRDSLERLAELGDAAARTTSGKYAALLDEFDRIGISKTSPERVVVFAERVATLHWLRERIMRDRTMSADQVRVLHGQLSDIEQQEIVDEFKQESSPIRVLVTGDVASEGVNLHRQCHELIHYEIPWSRIRIEQRNGRIDRYGQTEPPRITTLLLQPETNASLATSASSLSSWTRSTRPTALSATPRPSWASTASRPRSGRFARSCWASRRSRPPSRSPTRSRPGPTSTRSLPS